MHLKTKAKAWTFEAKVKAIKIIRPRGTARLRLAGLEEYITVYTFGTFR